MSVNLLLKTPKIATIAAQTRHSKKAVRNLSNTIFEETDSLVSSYKQLSERFHKDHNNGLCRTILDRINCLYEEMSMAMSDIVETISSKIYKTGDLYTYDELGAIQGTIASRPDINIKDLIKYRGNAASLDNMTPNVHFKNIGELKNELEEYVNTLVKFKSKEANTLAARVNRIDNGIRSHGIIPEQKIIYRGERDDNKIARMIHMCELKKINPGKKIVYSPAQLLSTSKSKYAVTEKGQFANKCLMEIETEGCKSRAIDVNKQLGQKNDYSWQEELLFSSDVELEILGYTIKNEKPVIRLKLL